jgi:GT2 family glycosyltransferase
VDWISGAAMALRRAALAEVGLLSDVFAFYCQDLEICSRLRQAGWEVDVLPGFRVRHHAGVTIGRSVGAVRGANPALLWADLVRYARMRGGPARARAAGRALRAGARLRILARLVAAPFLGGDSRDAWKRETAAFHDALRAVAELEAAASAGEPGFAVPPKLL